MRTRCSTVAIIGLISAAILACSNRMIAATPSSVPQPPTWRTLDDSPSNEVDHPFLEVDDRVPLAADEPSDGCGDGGCDYEGECYYCELWWYFDTLGPYYRWNCTEVDSAVCQVVL